MGLFGLFGKAKKETLNKGLEKTKESVFKKLARAIVGKSKVDEEVLDNLEEVLISSDVGVDTTVRIIERIEARVEKDKYMGVDELNRVLREEIAALLKENEVNDGLGKRRPLGSWLTSSRRRAKRWCWVLPIRSGRLPLTNWRFGRNG